MLFTALRDGRSHPESVKAGANKLVGLLCLKGVGSEGFVYTSRRLCGRDLVTASSFLFSARDVDLGSCPAIDLLSYWSQFH